MKRTIVCLILSLAAAGAAELPVRQVVLYKHGVGFFERSGRLGPGESARLDFTAAEMNDVLKSLTVEEKGGGKITGLRYDSMDPLSHSLEAFPFRIGNAEPLAAMLDQLKGSRIELQLGGGTVAGAIVSARLAAATDKQPEREQITLMMDGGELRTLDLGAASGIRFSDPQLQQQFREYLAALAAARAKDRRSVYIDSTDSGARDLTASYTIPAAVWKSSYRLIFGAPGKPVIEGWAIVDNTTGEDWKNIQLSLVSGRPISFVSQLYPPKYVERPAAELPEDSAARPVLHPGGFAVAGTGGVLGGVAGRLEAAPSAGLMAPEAFGTAKSRNAGSQALEVAPSTIVQGAAGQELGELFEYRIAQPVTIQKGQSAMLPFLQQPIEARKLLIYSDHSSMHPTNAAELTNTSGKTLDGGPVTVYDSGAYGGEALMETLKAGDKRLISYAVDLGTRITEAFNSKQAVVREIHARRGILTTKTAAEETHTYTIKNVDQKAKTLIIEHPLRPGYTLLNPKPWEKTPEAYRFETTLAADASQEFPVSEERVYDQSYSVINLTPDVLLDYVQNRALSDAGKRQLQQIADQKAAIAASDRAIQDVQGQIREMTSDEDRIRRNIGSLNNVSGQQQQVQTYARQLDQHEQRLAALRDQQAELQKKNTALEGELNRMINGLTF
jgi:chaperonin cofactor prefoldin